MCKLMLKTKEITSRVVFRTKDLLFLCVIYISNWFVYLVRIIYENYMYHSNNKVCIADSKIEVIYIYIYI